MTTTEITSVTATGRSLHTSAARRRLHINIKLCIVAAVLALFTLILLSFQTVGRLSEDLWKQLGISQQEGSEKITNGFIYGFIDYSGAKNVRNLSAGNKVAVAKELLIFTKSYLNSSAFKAAYAKERNASKPEVLALLPVTKEGIRKERIEELKKNIAEAEAAVKKMPSLEKSAQKAIAGYEKAIKDYESPDSKMLNIFYETAVNQQKSKQQKHDKRIQEWEANYPENLRVKIKKYLENYLSTAATVDFNAALTEKFNKRVFVNNEYESKNGDWKRIFRAGKDVYYAIKPVAEQWLREIQ